MTLANATLTTKVIRLLFLQFFIAFVITIPYKFISLSFQVAIKKEHKMEESSSAFSQNFPRNQTEISTKYERKTQYPKSSQLLAQPDVSTNQYLKYKI